MWLVYSRNSKESSVVKRETARDLGEGEDTNKEKKARRQEVQGCGSRGMAL